MFRTFQYVRSDTLRWIHISDFFQIEKKYDRSDSLSFKYEPNRTPFPELHTLQKQAQTLFVSPVELLQMGDVFYGRDKFSGNTIFCQLSTVCIGPNLGGGFSCVNIISNILIQFVNKLFRNRLVSRTHQFIQSILCVNIYLIILSIIHKITMLKHINNFLAFFLFFLLQMYFYQLNIILMNL